jgi:uncharacterized protein (TIGR00297 family)
LTDPLAFALFSAVLLGAVLVGEGLRAWAGWAPESSRRAVHAGVGVATALCPPLFSEPGPVYLLAGLFVAVNLVAVPRRLLPGMHAISRPSWGTVTFPLALLAALALTWSLDPARVYILQAAFLVLGLADPAASFVGTRLRRPGAYRVGPETKSVAGSAAFLGVAWVCAACMLAWLGPSMAFGSLVAASFVVAALATAAEALGRKGWDNLWIVLAVVVSLTHLHLSPDAAMLHLGALVVAAGFGLLAFRARSLDLSGALSASLLAWMVVALGGAAWALPAFAFFVLSSLLSSLGRRRKAAAHRLAEKGSRRDVGQVLANGGVAGTLLAAHVFAPVAVLYWGFVASFAAAAADTWGTEIGTWLRGRTRLLAFGRTVPPGTSGGMSLGGTLGAVGGAVSVLAAALLAPGASFLPWGASQVVAAVIGAAVGAAFLDSLLGATVQARYRDLDGSLTERTHRDGHALPLMAGRAWVDNDVVNLACTLWGGLVALAALSA